MKGSSVHKTSKIEAGSELTNSTMGRYSFCGYGCDINNTTIGSFTSIANGVVIGGGAHPIDWVGTSPVFYQGRDSVRKKFSEYPRDPVKRTTVGHDVWIGRNSIIAQGVNIGNGAVVGMGSVVTKDVSPYSIVGGVPAKLIRYRFDEKLIQKLLDVEWWSLDDSILVEAAVYIREPKAFLAFLEDRGIF